MNVSNFPECKIQGMVGRFDTIEPARCSELLEQGCGSDGGYYYYFYFTKENENL